MTAPQVRTPGGNRANAGQITDGAHIVGAASFCGNPDAERKAFETLRAAAAFKGYTLARTNPADGAVTYYASRWGLVRELRDLAAVAAFIVQIGGAA